jgi:hypothetical protein
MENWPCRSDAAREEIKKYAASGQWVGLSIPVFTKDGERVPPAEYEARLKGALVDVHVAISQESWKVQRARCLLCTLQTCLITTCRVRAPRTSSQTSAQLSSCVARAMQALSSPSKRGLKLPERLRAAKKRKV